MNCMQSLYVVTKGTEEPEELEKQWELKEPGKLKEPGYSTLEVMYECGTILSLANALLEKMPN